jgi:hypothetical protein
LNNLDHFAVEYFFDDVIDPVIEKISHAHFRIVDDFGDIKFGYRKYAIKKIDFYTESLHRIAGQSFPLEMIASAELIKIPDSKKLNISTNLDALGSYKQQDHRKSQKHSQILKKPVGKSKKQPVLKKLKFSVIFEQATVPFVELYPLGIGRGLLRQLPTKREDPKSSSLPLHTTFNLGFFVDKYKKAIWYSAHSMLDKCEPANFVVMFETLWVSPEQLNEFRMSFHERIRSSQKLPNNEPIYTNFISKA